MRKKFLSLLLLLVGFAWAAPAAADDVWAVTDTVIEDGYYRLHTTWWKSGTTTSNGTDSIMSIRDAGDGSATYAAYRALYCKSAQQVTENDWDCIWHIWKAGKKDGHQTYHFKNCGTNISATYFYPEQHITGQCSWLFAVGEEMDSVMFRTKDYGSTASSGRTTVLNRKDVVSLPGAAFIVPTLSNWRFRIGANNSLPYVKLNSYDQSGCHEWRFEKVDLGDKQKLMTLNEAITDALGHGFELGVDPGSVTNSAALVNFDAVIADAQDLLSNGGTDEELTAMTAKVKAASDECLKYQVSLEEGYYAIRSQYAFAGNAYKWMTIFNDWEDRPNCGTFNLSNTTALTHNKHANRWFRGNFWFGYTAEQDMDASNIPYQYIWHLKKAPDGNFYIKNCALESPTEAEINAGNISIGDSTYFYSCITSPTGQLDKLGVDYWSHFVAAGTPQMTVHAKRIKTNQFNIYNSTNPYFWNCGENSFNTNNPCNAATAASWEIFTVPESRITDKVKLNEAITDAGGVFVDWTTDGKTPTANPGTIKQAVAAPLVEALTVARKVYAEGGDYASATTALTAVYNNVMNQLADTAIASNPLEEGYYRIESSDIDFLQVTRDPDVRPTFYGGEDAVLRWDTNFDRDNADKLFKITKSETEGKWYVQCVGTGKYLQGTNVNSKPVAMSNEPYDVNINANLLAHNVKGYNWWNTNGNWILSNYARPDLMMHLCNHSDGKGTGSYIEQWSTAYGAQQFLQRETDQANIDKLVEIGAQRARNIRIYEDLVSAGNILDRTINYTFNPTDSLIYEAGAVHLTALDGSDSIGYDRAHNQFDSNNQQIGDGNYAGLIDGRSAYHWHAQYNVSGVNKNTPTADTYLQVDLRDKPQQNFIFLHTLRGNTTLSNGHLDGKPTRAYMTDNGQLHRPLDFTITATNDTVNGPWTQVKSITNINTDDNFRDYYSPLVQADKAYRFYRFSVHQTYSHAAYNNIEYWDAGRFQVYPATLDEANSPYYYDANIKAAADKVKDLIAKASSEYAAGTATQATIEDLNAAADALNKIAPDTMPVSNRIFASYVLADSSYVYDNEDEAQFGDVSATQKAALFSAISTARTAIQPDAHPTPASIASAYQAIDRAYWTLNGQRKTFMENQWYYLRSTEKQGYGGPRVAWRGDQFYYATDASAQNAIADDTVAYRVGEIRYGHNTGFVGQAEGQTQPKNLGDAIDYSGGSIDVPENPYTMWRFVHLGDSLYAVQNRATGLFIGRTQDLNWYVAQSKEPMKCAINIIGRNQFEIVNMDSVNGCYYGTAADASSSTKTHHYNQPLHQQGNDFRAVWWGTGSENNTARGCNTGSALTFLPVSEDDVVEQITMSAKDNNVEIKSYPFDLCEPIFGNIENVMTYKLKSVTPAAENTYKIELTEIDPQETPIYAGEPFILWTGDPTDPTASHDSIAIYLDLTKGTLATTTIEGKNVNGLHAVLYGDSISNKPGLGLFYNHKTWANSGGLISETITSGSSVTVTDSAAVFIDGQQGFIQPAETKDAGGTADKVITVTGTLDAINAVEINTIKKNANVYDIDGKLLRRNSTSTKGLQKGVYIVDGQKVVVE